jgi:hypothetical protein
MRPEKGFYYHYKRDPKAAVNEYAYEVLGTAFSTEAGSKVLSPDSEDIKEFEKTEVVIYQPLYESALVYGAGKLFWTRPVSMFLEKVMKDGQETTRFIKITDPEIIKQLEAIRDKLYAA